MRGVVPEPSLQKEYTPVNHWTIKLENFHTEEVTYLSKNLFKFLEAVRYFNFDQFPFRNHF